MLEIASDYKLEEIPTSALVLVGDGEYSEVWVTFSSSPYWSDTVYNRITSYIRREPMKYAVVCGMHGYMCEECELYPTKKAAIEAYIIEIERTIDAGYALDDGMPGKTAVSKALTLGGHTTEFDRRYYVTVEKYSPF